MWSAYDVDTTKIASGKQQTKVTLTFLIVIQWFQVKCLQQQKTKKWGRKTWKLVMALYNEVQVLKTYGFGVRLNASPKILPSGFQGLWTISAHLPYCSQTTYHRSSEKEIKRCYAFLQSYHPEAFVFDSLIYRVAQISQFLLKLMQPKSVWCRWALCSEQLRLGPN